MTKIYLPVASALWDFVDGADGAKKGRLKIHTIAKQNKKRSLRCPKCDRPQAGLDKFKEHIDKNHLQFWRLAKERYTDTHYIPRQLAKTAIRVEKSTNLAVCLWEGCFLLRDEIYSHAMDCIACDEASWSTDVEDDSFNSICNDKLLQDRETQSRVMVGMTVSRGNCNSCCRARKIHGVPENPIASERICTKYTDYGNNYWIHRGFSEDQIPDNIAIPEVEVVYLEGESPGYTSQKLERQWSKFLAKGSVYDLVIECLLSLDDCTFQLHHKMAQRWQNTKFTNSHIDYFYSVLACLDTPTLDFTRVFQVELLLQSLSKSTSKLSVPPICMDPSDLDEEARSQLNQHGTLCKEVSDRVFRLLCVALNGALTPNEIVDLAIRKTAHSKQEMVPLSIQIDGCNVSVVDQHGKAWHLPWIVGELLVRYYAIIRPLHAIIREKIHTNGQRHNRAFDNMNVPLILESLENEIVAGYIYDDDNDNDDNDNDDTRRLTLRMDAHPSAISPIELEMYHKLLDDTSILPLM